MALPYGLLKQLWDAGYGGKVIRVPPMNDKGILKARANELLREIEEAYEQRGTTFVLEKMGRRDFYRSFGLLRLSRRFHLQMDQIRRVRRRAYWRWIKWMRDLEEPRLMVAGRFSGNGEGRMRYLEMRKRIRAGQPLNGNEPKELLRAARDSISSATWR